MGKAADTSAARRESRRAGSVPTGTVTFLFTDIEGSTSMWEDYPAQMHEALARHDEILRASVEASGGHVFKTVGDAFCAAFDTARQALEATLAAQRALFAEEWDENARIKVRMALHTGVAEERDGDYFGPPMNRVARLLSTGHGGQVLLSAVTYGLVRDVLGHLEPEAELRDLGEHRLRDLRYTERIYQLVVPDLPKNFPELKTHGLVTPNLSPAPVADPPPPNEESRPVGPGEDRYRRIRPMGSGGMAEVYLAHDKVLDRDVALKVLRREYADDEQFIERFEREARNVASLSHPNIVAVHDRGVTEEGSYFMVMECVPGGTLKERIQGVGALPAPAAVEITLQIARALQAAHRRGVIHRDIKPQNVLLAESGEAKVADFGIARAVSSTSVTRTGALLGTAHYISPEQALGQPATFQSDLYSLGVVLYEMLTGDVPHDAETPIGVAMKHVNGSLRPPREANSTVPEGLNAVVMRLLAKDPAERYGDAAELIADLERIERGESPPALREDGVSPAFQETVLDHEEVGSPRTTPQAAPQRGKRLVLMATAVGLLLVLLTGGGAMALTGLGPGLLAASKNEPTDESSSTQTPDVQQDAAAEEEAVEEESAEETSSSSDDSTGTSGAASDSGDDGQVPAAQTDQGGQTAEVAPPSGTSKQESTTPTKEKDSSTVEVPNLAGLPVSDAISKLTAEGLTLGDRREVPSDNVARGKVMSQDPAPGTKADKGSSVSIVCSCGEPQQKGTTPPQKENTAPQQKDVAPSQQKDAPPQQKTAPSPQQKGASPTP